MTRSSQFFCIVVLLIGAGAAAVEAQFVRPPADRPDAVFKASDFKPPLTSGKERRYDLGFETVLSAMRSMLKALPIEPLGEWRVESMAIFEVRQRSLRNLPGRDSIRFVIEPLGDRRTAVRILWPAAATFAEGRSEDLYFRELETRF